MKPNNEILDESLSYYNVEGLVQTGSRLWMAIIAAMDAVRAEYEHPVPKKLTPDDFERVPVEENGDSIICNGCYFEHLPCFDMDIFNRLINQFGNCNDSCHIFKLKSK